MLKVSYVCTHKITTMHKIEIRKIIEAKGLKFSEVGRKLFPKAKYPYLALKRAMDGKYFLNSEQVSIFSQVTGVPISELFTRAWKISGNLHEITFTSGDYTALQLLGTREIKVLKNSELIQVLEMPPGSVLSELINKLNEIILNKSN